MSGELFGQSRKYSYQHITEEQGLSQNFVYGLIQDDRGFLWAGTGTGLSRYDGFELKNFTTKEGMSSDFVTTAFRMASGNLIFGHNQGGVSLFDGVHFKSLLSDTLGAKVVSITEDSEQNIWIATQSKGLIFIDKSRSNTFTVFPAELQGQIINNIYARGRLLWVGTHEGLFFYHMNGNLLTLVENDVLPPYAEVTSILRHRNNSALCWVATAVHGIYLLQHHESEDKVVTQQKFQMPDFSNDIIQTMDQDADGDLWIGTRQHGVLHLNIGRDGMSIFKIHSFGKTSGFPITAVNNLIVDSQGQIWTGTMGSGLIKIYKDFFTYFPFAAKYGVTDVRSIAETISGYLVATDIGLLQITFNSESNEYDVDVLNVLKNESVLSLYTDSKKNTWVGTENKGVFIFPKGSKNIQAVNIDQDGGLLKVRLFEEDKNDNIWMSAFGQGIYVLDKTRTLIKHMTTANRFIHNDIFAIKADSKGNIWFGTYGAGLARMSSKGELDLFSKQETLKARDINDIDEDAAGNIWIATEGDGFFKYADNKFTQIGSNENLVSPFIKGIQYDPQGLIWYSYRKGVGYFDLKSEKKHHFTEKDGLVSSEAYSTFINVDSKSNKWFCNDYGITLFENDTIRNYRKELETYLTGIRIFFKDYPVHLQKDNELNRSMVAKLPALKLTHKENHITFDFVAIELNRTGKIYYRHLLEGYDSEWTPPETVNFVTYTNLDPGEYVLKIQATDDLGAWVDPITRYSFTITPPYWKRTWFYLLQIVSVLTLFVLTYFIGKKGIATKRYVLRLMLFSSFFIILEYVENFVDPLVSDFFGGAPVFRFFLNFLLALLLLPIESLIRHWLMDDEKKLPETSSPIPETTEVPVPLEEEKIETQD